MGRESTAERIAVESRRVEKVYSVLARVYDAFFDWALGPGRRHAVRRLPIRPGDRVLEVGVGTGLALPFYPADCRLAGIDISEPMLERARQRALELGRHDVELRRMDARELKFPDASFDHVLAPYVMSVVPDPERVMAEMVRVCRPDGTISVVNHFGSRRPPLGWLERAVTPLSQWLGFRMDLSLERITSAEGVVVTHTERVNLLGLWRLVEMRRLEDGATTD